MLTQIYLASPPRLCAAEFMHSGFMTTALWVGPLELGLSSSQRPIFHSVRSAFQGSTRKTRAAVPCCLRMHLKRSTRFERYKCSHFENTAINKSYFNYISVTEGLKVRADKSTCLNIITAWWLNQRQALAIWDSLFAQIINIRHEIKINDPCTSLLCFDNQPQWM